MKTIAQQLNIKDFPFIINDKNGNRIYFENRDNYCYRRERDENGNVIYYEDSDGYWSKRERDQNGNEIYYEDSEGTIEDNRPKTCKEKIVEIDGKKYKLTEV